MPGTSPTSDRLPWTTVLITVLCTTVATVLVITLGVLAFGHDDDESVATDTTAQTAPGTDSGPASTSASTAASSSASSAESSPAPASGTSSGGGTVAGSGSEPAESGAGGMSGTGGTGTSTGTGDSGAASGASSTSGTAPTPTAGELTDIVHLLTATDASDEEKSRYLESPDALVVPQTVSRAGLFRAPRGGSEITGPVTRDGDTVTVQLHAWSQGIPDVSMPVQFIYRDGTWRLADSSVCSGVRTVGLPVYCNA